MASQLENDDCLLVGRDGADYKVSYTDFAAQMKIDIGRSLIKEVHLKIEREMHVMKQELKQELRQELEELRREEG